MECILLEPVECRIDLLCISLEYLEILLEQGIDPNMYSHGGYTLLTTYNEISSHNYEHILFLMKYGLDLNHKDRFGETPLIRAVYIGDTYMIKFLLDHGADKSIGDRIGRSAAHVAYSLDKNAIYHYIKNYK